MLKSTSDFLSKRSTKFIFAALCFIVTVENIYFLQLSFLADHDDVPAAVLAAILTIAFYFILFYGFDFFEEKKEGEINHGKASETR